MKCIRCKKEINPNMKFCKYSGTPVEQSVQADKNKNH